jgi:hypothetical protein
MIDETGPHIFVKGDLTRARGERPIRPRRSWFAEIVVQFEQSHKGQFFVEIQFGNSSAIYRDYYKFRYSLVNAIRPLQQQQIYYGHLGQQVVAVRIVVVACGSPNVQCRFLAQCWQDVTGNGSPASKRRRNLPLPPTSHRGRDRSEDKSPHSRYLALRHS